LAASKDGIPPLLTKPREIPMTDKIRELNLDDLKTVAGGLTALSVSTSNTLYASTSSSLLIKPTSSTSLSTTYTSPIRRF
jgi:hypothetical protein